MFQIKTIIKLIIGKALLASTIFMTLYPSVKDNKTIEINRDDFRSSPNMNDLKLYHNGNGFIILKNGVSLYVQNCMLDREIRSLTNEQLSRFLGNIRDIEIKGQTITLTKVSKEEFETFFPSPIPIKKLTDEENKQIISKLSPKNYLAVEQLDNGEYQIHATSKLLGGGVGGGMAGYWIGRFSVHLAAQLGIAAVTGVVFLVNPPAAVAVGIALEKTVAPAVEAASQTVGFGGAIIGMIATGPA